MFDVQLLMIPFLLISTIMANSGLFFKDVLELLMVATFIFLHPLPFKISIGIGKAFFHRIVFSYVISACSSHIFSQAGKALQQMHGSGLMPWQKVFQCLQDFHIAQN